MQIGPIIELILMILKAANALKLISDQKYVQSKQYFEQRRVNNVKDLADQSNAEKQLDQIKKYWDEVEDLEQKERTDKK